MYIDTLEFCANCGQKSSKSTQQPTSNSFWNANEKYVVLAGKFSWVLLILYVIWTLFFNVIFNDGVGEVIWGLIRIALIIGISSIFLKDFVAKCIAKDWYFLVNDVIIIADYRIPKMLFYSIILTIFAYGWGSLLVLIVAIVVIFVGPEKVVWKVEHSVNV